MHALRPHTKDGLGRTEKPDSQPNRGNPKPSSSMRKYAALFHAKNRNLRRSAQHKNAANHLNRAGSALAFCAECPHTASIMKKLQAFFVVMLTLLGTASCQQGVNPSSSNSKLVPPAQGKMKVAFIVTEGAVMIDFAGPWEVFQDVMVPSRGEKMEDQHVFELYTVSDNKNPILVSGGMQVVPDYTFDDAPEPMVIVIPAQTGDSPKMLAWIRKISSRGNVVMSVCTGAFKLAETGLLKGKPATTHHGAYASFQHQFPDIQVERDKRWVQSSPTIFTAGGLSSGIDLALHVVELYFGRDIAGSTAAMMEYEGQGWKGDGSALAKHYQPAVKSNPSDNYSSGVLGNWHGKIVSKEGVFQVAVHIWPDKDGKLTGTLDSLDEEIGGLKLDPITFQGPDLHFTVPAVEGTYEAKLNAQESAIEGTWTQHRTSAPLVLERVSK
jgi:putative intracellular protease/amidase